jgi:hypothetical protein
MRLLTRNRAQGVIKCVDVFCLDGKDEEPIYWVRQVARAKELVGAGEGLEQTNVHH